MTPFEIKLLLHMHMRPSHHPLDCNQDLVDSTIVEFCIHGLAENYTTTSNGPQYKLTDLGKAYIDVLMNTPIPTIDYIDEFDRNIAEYPGTIYPLGHIPETPKGGG